MKLYAVTGPMAAGKNVVCQILTEMGFACIDADKLAHKAVEVGKDKILSTFGEDAKKSHINLLNEDGTINRRNLGEIVFANPENLAKQEAIIHPLVTNMMKDFIDDNFALEKNVVLNATVLYKTPLIYECDAIIYVTAPLLTRFFRVLKRDKMKISQIFQRFWAQKDLFAKYNFLNTDIYRVNNNVSIKKLRKKLEAIIQ